MYKEKVQNNRILKNKKIDRPAASLEELSLKICGEAILLLKRFYYYEG